MSGVPRGTTPTFELTFKEDWLDLRQAQEVAVTFECPGYSFTKRGDSLVVNEKSIEVLLSQTETMRFCVGKIDIMVNWLMPDGTRIGSEVKQFPITRQLLKEIML